MVGAAGILLVAIHAAAGLGSALPPLRIGTVVTDSQASSDSGANTASLKQVRNPHYRPNGALSVYKTYLKYGAPPPEYLVKAVQALDPSIEQKRETGSAAAIPIDARDTAYVTPVAIGTPAQILHLDFDTGSSDLWVFSNYTPTSQVRGQELYKPALSTTAELLTNHSWSIAYGDGSTSRGNVFIDSLSVGGVTARNQAIGCAQQVSASFTRQAQMDGLAGLGFSSLNTIRPSRQVTFFDNVKAKLDKPLFATDLKYHAGMLGSPDFT